MEQVAIICDVAGCRAEVDDPLCLWALLPVGVDMGHHIVAELFFISVGLGDIDVIDLLFEGFDLGGGDRKSAGLLPFGKGYPKFSPCRVFVVGGKQVGHLRACITGGEGGCVMVHGLLLSVRIFSALRRALICFF